MSPLGRPLGPLPCAVLLAVVLHLTGLARPRAPIAPAGATADDRIDDHVEGTVGAPVVTMPRGYGAPLHTDAATIWMWSRMPIAPGQRVAVTGRLRTPRGFLDPGSPDLAAQAATRGASWELDAARVDLIADAPDALDHLWRWAARTQNELTARIAGDATVHDPARAALAGIVTGDRTAIDPALDARWRAIGIFHVLSVSGLHLAVVAGLLFALLRRLIAGSPLGARCNPASWAAPIAFVFAVAYTMVTGAQLATLRALIVVAIVMAAQMMNRPIRLLDATGAAAIVILLWRPQDLYDASFQLSFIAALTLAVVPSAPHADDAGRLRRWARKLRRGLATSAWVALTTAPITALHFQQVAAGGVVGNLVLTPLVELAALPLGFAGAVLHSAILIDVAAWLVARVDDGAALLAHIVPVCTVGLGSPTLCVVLVTTALVVCAASRERAGIVKLGWIVLCAAWALAPRGPASGTLRVTFLDVGQGDAALVEVPGGEVWLIDAGGLASSRDVLAASAPGEAITRTLAVYGRDAIDVAILSHPHPDHFMGLGGLGVPVRELWLADRSAAQIPVIAELVRRGTRIVVPPLGIARTADGAVLEVLAPRLDGAVAPDPVRTVNDNSLVVALSYAGRRFLFAGDLEAEGEAELVEAGLSHVDVVKVAHHGSRTSSSAPFVAATRPAVAVISCGVANAFGFPAPEVVERWRTIGAAVARTDVEGAVIVRVARDGRLLVGR